MSKVENMSLEEILNITDLIMEMNDIRYICQDIDTIIEYDDLNRSHKMDNQEIKEFLIKHKDKFDEEENDEERTKKSKIANKEKLVLLLATRYKENLKAISRAIEQNKKVLLEHIDVKEDILLGRLRKNNYDLRLQEKVQKENFKKTLKLGKGIERFLCFYMYNDKKGRYELQVIDSREVFDGISNTSKKNEKKFDEIDNELKEKDGDEEYGGIEYALLPIILTDYTQIFPDERFGENVRMMLLENAILRDGLKTQKEIEEMKAKSPREYLELRENTEFEEDMLPDIKKSMRQYIQYVDMDKLLLISAYRLREVLERKMLDEDGNEIESFKKEALRVVKKTMEVELKHIKNRDNIFTFELEEKGSETGEREICSISTKDIEDCLKNFVGDTYLREHQKEEYREKIEKGELNLLEINPDFVDLIFSEKELDKLARLSEENLSYVSIKFDWEKDKILEVVKDRGTCSKELLEKFIDKGITLPEDIVDLYMSGAIELGQIKEIEEKIDLTKSIPAQQLITYYKESLESGDKENNRKYDRYLTLYKEIILKDKSQKELDQESDKIMDAILEGYSEKEKEKYIQMIEKAYKDGVLNLNSILIEEDNITRLYDDGLIDMEDIKGLVKDKKLPFEYMEERYNKTLWNKDTDWNQKLEIIKSGWISEETVVELYKKALISDKNLEELEKLAIVREETVKAAKGIPIEQLEANAAIVFNFENGLQKIKTDKSIYSTGERKGYDVKDTKAPKLLIDPNRRKELFDLLGAMKIKDSNVKISEGNPFYNYDFYVLPDESGKEGKNSVVIAERYYEEKEREIDESNKKENIKQPKELRFAFNNATYFFRYRDLLVLSNYLRKDEAVKSVKDVVFRANHTLATEEKPGHWAASVLYGIAKTTLSSDLKEYSKREQREKVIEVLNNLYSHDQIMKILDKSSDIDEGKYIYEVEEASDTRLNKNKAPKRSKENPETPNGSANGDTDLER